MTARRFRDDDSGVATAIGAVMLVALMFSVLVLVQTVFVPVWEEEAESSQARRNQAEFTALLTELDRRIGNESVGPVTLPVTMEDGGGGAFGFGGAELPAELSVSGGVATVGIASDDILIHVLDGNNLGGLNETWTDLASATTLTDVYDVQHLRLRITDPESGNDGDAITLEVIDAQGANAGTLTAYIDRFPSGYAVNVLVEDPLGTVLFDGGESRFHQDAPPFTWINTLQADYLFAPLLAAAAQPLTLNIQENGLEGAFTIQYTSEGTGGTTIIGGTGLHIPDYSAGFRGGTLELHTQNQNFPQQRYVLEHGALILVQDDGASMLVEPSFQPSSLGNTTSVSMTLVDVQGDNRTLASQRPARVTFGDSDTLSFTASAPHFSINLTSEWPDVWTGFWAATLDAAGWSSGTGHYAIQSGDGWAHLQIYGETVAPASTQHDLSITLHQATVDTSIQI